MKVEIRRNGKTENIDLQVKAKNGRDLLVKMLDAQNVPMEDTGKATLEYLDLLDSITSDSSGLSVDELNELDLDEKNKLTGKVVELARDSLGFSRLFTK